MRRIGCLIVVIAIAIAAWLTRDRWLPRSVRSAADSSTPALRTWQPLTPKGAQTAAAMLQRLQARTGPAYVSVAPGDLAAYILQELSRTLPATADSIEAAAIGDRLYVRAIVPIKDLGGAGTLGPLAALLGDRERVQLGGTLRIIQPGQAELQVRELKVGSLSVPQALIPKLIQQISRGQRPPGLSPNGLLLRTPSYIGDVRVTDGKITMYKAAP
ncbi:MAG TPA: hypothetical protein VJ867_00995 [Gemmatimonadaceae bacterium]|nr:hypothetical protein [Gemmatimonadaceae bacterium]